MHVYKSRDVTQEPLARENEPVTICIENKREILYGKMWSKIYFICIFPHFEILNYPVSLENITNKQQQQKPLKVRRNILAQITENKYFFILSTSQRSGVCWIKFLCPMICPDATKNIRKLSKGHHTSNPELEMIYILETSVDACLKALHVQCLWFPFSSFLSSSFFSFLSE